MTELINNGESDRLVSIVTDSVAQVPQELAEKLSIGIVPSVLIMNGKEYLDGIDIETQSLYQEMRKKELIIQTTAPPVGFFYRAFEEKLNAGVNSVLYIGLTSQLSATFSSAEAAAHMITEKFPEQSIELYDTKTATIAQGFIAIEAAKLARRGEPLGEILDRAKKTRNRVGFVASLETLEYLVRGGRIGRVAYMMGSLIKILPIVTIDDNGYVAPLARVRGDHRVLTKIVETVAQRVEGYRELRLAIMHADASDKLLELEELIRYKLDPTELSYTDFTPVMGAHTGPGVIGLAYYFE